MTNKPPAVRLREAPTNTLVRLHYESSRGKEKTETGVKSGSGRPIDSAMIDVQEGSGKGDTRKLRINNGGLVEVVHSDEAKQIGRLQDIEFPDKNTAVVSLDYPEEIDWLARGRFDADMSTSEALREHTYRATKELLQAVGIPLDPDDLPNAEVEDAYTAFRDAVNMTPNDLRAWGDHDCSDTGLVKPEEVRQLVLDLLTKPKDDWDAADVDHAQRVADFIMETKDAPQGDPDREGCPSVRDATLMNWGYKPKTVDLSLS